MFKETFNGNDSLFSRNDGHVSGLLVPSALSTQKDHRSFFEVTGASVNEKEKPHLDIHRSNRYYDFYLFYFSSKL